MSVSVTSEIHSDWPVGVKSISQAGGYLVHQLGFIVLDYNWQYGSRPGVTCLETMRHESAVRRSDGTRYL